MSSAKKASAAQVFSAGVDIKWFRDKTSAELDVWRQNQIKRHRPPELIDEIVAEDTQYRAKLKQKTDLAKQKGVLMQSLNPKSDKGAVKTDAEKEQIKEQCRQMSTQIEDLEKETQTLFDTLEKKLCLIGAMIAPEVPVSYDEKDNKVICTFGRIPVIPNFRPHSDLLAMIDGYEPFRGSRIAGHRGYYLKGAALRLNQALFRYGLDFLESRKFTPVHTPFFMNAEVMGRVCQLEDFRETLYRVAPKKEDEGDGLEQPDEMFLIATSEQPLCGFHINEVLGHEELPKRYAGFSTCFRKEAGASGKDNLGIFRVHQFEKVEQFCITSPHDNESWKMHDEMVGNSCEFIKSLGLPFHAVLIVSGELNYSTARKVDIEAWYPSYNAYRELVSASNCLDFQSRKLDIRYRGKGNTKEKEYVHMLNATLCATERTLCCILENYQTPDGIRVPKVLQPYMRELAAQERLAPHQYENQTADAQAMADAMADDLKFKNIEFIPFVLPAPSAQPAAPAPAPAPAQAAK